MPLQVKMRTGTEILSHETASAPGILAEGFRYGIMHPNKLRAQKGERRGGVLVRSTIWAGPPAEGR